VSRLVSIAIPTFNGERTIEAAVRSGLEQSYEPIEVVVSDDSSTDGTVDTLRRMGIGPTINPRRVGANRNWNESVNQSRGEFIKFLHQDDQLEPQCVSRMVEMFDRYPTAGMVFCRRSVGLHRNSPHEQSWRELYRDPHTGFAALEEFNLRGSLSDQLLANHLSANWIGEPVCVMVRRELLERLGGFHNHVRQLVDLDLWFRIAAHSDIVFIDEALATYRCSIESLTARNRSAGVDWLDVLWILHGLTTDVELLREHPEVSSMREQESRMARRTLLSRRYGTPSLRVWLRYLAQRYVLRAPIYGEIGAPPDAEQHPSQTHHLSR
jgi:glycosyltransferase involved in cell wall biosynthesis